MARCRNDPTRWALMTDVSNHLTALNPDVPDFQPGKIWTNETKVNETDWNHVSTKRKKPAKKKV
jgi:hypothetical protein